MILGPFGGSIFARNNLSLYEFQWSRTYVALGLSSLVCLILAHPVFLFYLMWCLVSLDVQVYTRPILLNKNNIHNLFWSCLFCWIKQMLGGGMVQNSEADTLPRFGPVHRRSFGIQLSRSQVFCELLGFVPNRVFFLYQHAFGLLLAVTMIRAVSRPSPGRNFLVTMQQNSFV